jgi:uncharacterized protein YdeI (YjbR/CyaY-like superfamily)
MPKDLPVIGFQDPDAWEKWLKKNHSQPDGIWMRIFKKDSKKPTVTYAQALDVALCYGWIDGLKRKYDADSWIQKFTPRRAKSGWSKINTGHAERLIKAKRMMPAGLAQITAAKKDGRWYRAYDSQKTIVVPADFLRELKKIPKAEAFYKNLKKANTYAIAYRLQTAKKPETRENRMKMILEMLKKGESFHS